MTGCQKSGIGSRRNPPSRRKSPLQMTTASSPHEIPTSANTGKLSSPA